MITHFYNIKTMQCDHNFFTVQDMMIVECIIPGKQVPKPRATLSSLSFQSFQERRVTWHELRTRWRKHQPRLSLSLQKTCFLLQSLLFFFKEEPRDMNMKSTPSQSEASSCHIFPQIIVYDVGHRSRISLDCPPGKNISQIETVVFFLDVQHTDHV